MTWGMGLPMRLSWVWILIGVALISGCVSADTNSTLSREDVRAGGYRRVLVFLENVSDEERAAAEKSITSAFAATGVQAKSGAVLFRGSKLSEQRKTEIVQRDFDAVLYINVQSRAPSIQVPLAKVDGNVVHIPTPFGDTITRPAENYVIASDGGVYRTVDLQSRAELQDTKSAKVVWASNVNTAAGHTMVSGGRQVVGGTLGQLEEVARQLVTRMRSDQII